MSNSKLLLLLKILNENRQIEELIEAGSTYTQISEFIRIAFEKEFITQENNILVLSNNGRNWLDEENKKAIKNKANRFLKPLAKEKIKKLGKNDVYLPKNK